MVDTDEYDRLRRRVLWSMPSGLYILGTRAGDRRNAMTLNLAMQVATEPKHIAVSVLKEAYSHRLIQDGGVFSLNILARDDRTLVRKFVKPVPWPSEDGSLNGVTFHDGRTGAPILDTAVAYLDCEIRQQIDVGDHTLMIGEVADAAFQRPEDTPVLRMEDTRMSYGG